MSAAPPLSLSAIYEKRQHSGGAYTAPPYQPTPPALSLQHFRPADSPSLTAALRPSTTSLSAAPPPFGVRDFGTSDSTVVATSPSLPVAKSPGPFPLPFDPYRALDTLYRHAPAALIVGVLIALPLYLLGRLKIEPHYIAAAQIIRTDPPNTFRASDAGEPFKPTSITVPVLINMMRASALLDRVAKATNPPLPASTILAGLVITPERNTDLVKVGWTSTTSPQQSVAVINAYARELVEYTKEMQARDAADVNLYLKREIARIEKDHLAVNEELLRYSKESDLIDADKEIQSNLAEIANYTLKYENIRLDYETLDIKILANQRELAKASPLAGAHRTSEEELATLRRRYTDANPIVQEAIEKEAQLREQMTQTQGKTSADTPPLPGESAVAESLYLDLVQLRSQKDVLAQQLQQTAKIRTSIHDRLSSLPRKSMEYALIKARRESLVTARTVLASRQREAQLFEENALGSCRVLAPARLEDVGTDARQQKTLLLGAAGLALGLLGTLGYQLWHHFRSGLVLTAGDLHRTTRLPVLAALPAALQNDRPGQRNWAFQTWTRIHPLLTEGSPGTALICGLLTDAPRPCQSHLTSLLGHAAVLRGSAVLCISPYLPPESTSMDLGEALASSHSDADEWLSSGTGIGYLTPGPDWTWTQPQQDQLLAALRHWSRHTTAVIFIDLPPAHRPETLRLAERLPKLLWVGTSGTVKDPAITQPLANYRHAGCTLVGSLLHAVPTLRPPFINQLAGHAALLFLSLSLVSAAPLEKSEVGSRKSEVSNAEASNPQSTSPRRAPRPGRLGERPWPLVEETPAPIPNSQFLIPNSPPIPLTPPGDPSPSPIQKSSLKTHNSSLPLGPGDGVNIQLFGKPDTARNQVTIGPDGTLTYLQAQSIPVTGLSIDELRLRLVAELSKYYTTPRLIVTPHTFQSRRVYLLGKIFTKGALNLDRPLTILEAVTQSGGLETGVFQQNTVELADLGRSFLVRGQRRVAIDFERLFYKGDMSQNLLLEPDDYLYFPSSNSNEIYIFGEVAAQGSQGIIANTTVTSAITQAGGFSPKAYRNRVLVVRGSLDKPQTFICDMTAVLSGRAKAFPLLPKDIIYVSRHPWAKAEELLETVLTSFVQGTVSGWTAANIQPLIKNAVLPTIPNTIR